MRFFVPFSLVFFLLSSFPAGGQTASDPAEGIRRVLQSELEDFTNWTSGPVDAPPLGPGGQEYLRRLEKIADRPQGSLRVRLGKIPLLRKGFAAESLGVTVFLPEGAGQGTLFFVHGYLSHSANFAYASATLARRGWTVVTLDLPGHGLSTGKRGDADAFSEYGDAVAAWLQWGWKTFPSDRRVLLAHSLGSAACLEALRRPSTPRPDKIVFCAPLLRPDWFPALSLGQFAIGWAMKDLPSTFGWDGYLDGYTMPTHWFEILARWLEALDSQSPMKLPLTIYSGDRDEVVDEGWNEGEYRRLVPDHRWVNLPGKGHLFLTNKEDRQDFLARLIDDLGL